MKTKQKHYSKIEKSQRVYQEVPSNLDVSFANDEDFDNLLKNYASPNLKEGEIMKARVINILNGNVILDFGYKSEGRIDLKEFPKIEQKDLKIGDEIEVYLDRLENKRAEPVLSRERAVKEASWDRLKRLCDTGQHTQGEIVARVKGGFAVDLGGAIAFLPGSQVDVKPIKDASPLLNVIQPFVILKMDEKRGNIVVSRRAILEESLTAEKDEALSKIAVGSKIEGIVKNITDYGAFIDMGVIDGLLHLTDISWKRVSHPSEVLKLGQKLELAVKQYDENTKRISLSLKMLEPNPWEGVLDKFKQGSEYKGVVVAIGDYGAYVEIESGIEGIVASNEISYVKTNIHPSKLLKVGDEVKVKIINIIENEARIDLSIKQCEENPWHAFTKKYSVGDIVKKQVKSVADFGLFVSFENEIDGLIHANELSWDLKGDKAIKNYKKGDEVEAKIIEIDIEKSKLLLSIKALTARQEVEKELASSTASRLNVGQIATFLVTKVEEGGIEVKYQDKISSYIKRNELSKDKVECRPERFSVGDKIDAKVIGYDKQANSYRVSIKAKEQDEERNIIAEYGSVDSGASLGDILGVALDKSKKK